MWSKIGRNLARKKVKNKWPLQGWPTLFMRPYCPKFENPFAHRSLNPSQISAYYARIFAPSNTKKEVPLLFFKTIIPLFLNNQSLALFPKIVKLILFFNRSLKFYSLKNIPKPF
jgi:hypothetical protein